MAWTPKTSGLASEATFILGCNQAGVLTEFKSSAVNADKTITGTFNTGSKAWKTVARPHFNIAASGSFNSTPVIAFGTNKPALPFETSTGLSIFVACAQMTAGNDDGSVFINNTNGHGFGLVTDGDADFGWMAGNVKMGTSSNPIPFGTTSFSMGGNIKTVSGGTYDLWYAAESTDAVSSSTPFLVAGGTGADGWGIHDTVMTHFGCFEGQGNSPGNYHIAVILPRFMTVAEYRTLHDSWFDTLFDVTASAPPIVTWW